jgi:hypothetical protein
MTKPRSRPVYTAELAHEICRRLLEGTPLKIICREEGMPSESTVRLWVLDDVEGFAALYARARLVGYHTMADDLIEIADNPEADAAAVNRDRLKVDTRKWLLSKALPKIYGDKLETTSKHQVVDGNERPVSMLEVARQIAFIFSSGMQELEEGEGEPKGLIGR